MYLDYRNEGAASYPGSPNPGRTVYFFNRELANEDADRLYDAMIANLNNTQNGNYMKSSDGGVQTTTFSAYNPAFALQGKAQTGQADDIFNNPTYEININSAGLAEDPAGTAMFGDIIRQYNSVNNTEYSVQKGDPALSQGEDFDPKVNDEVANKLFELWIKIFSV